MDKLRTLAQDNPVFTFMGEAVNSVRHLKWCAGHWAELMFALKDRNLSDKIAASAEELNQKFIRGESDPCWEACNAINMGALEVFGPDRIIDDHKGCPVCAFTQMISFVADGAAMRFGSKH